MCRCAILRMLNSQDLKNNYIPRECCMNEKLGVFEGRDAGCIT